MSTRHLSLLLAVVYVVATVGLAMGCSSDTAVSRADFPHRPVVLQRPAVPPAVGNHAAAGASTRSGYVPWYASRNDRRPTVEAGVRSPVLTRSSTRTYDRTAIYDGRASNDFIQRRVTEQVVESVR